MVTKSNSGNLYWHITSSRLVRLISSQHHHRPHITTISHYSWWYLWNMQNSSKEPSTRKMANPKWIYTQYNKSQFYSQPLHHKLRGSVTSNRRLRGRDQYNYQHQFSDQLFTISRYQHRLKKQCGWPPTSSTTSNISYTWGTITTSYTWSQFPFYTQWTDKNQTRLLSLLILLWCPSPRWLSYSGSNGRPNILFLHIRQGHRVLSWTN